MKNKKRTFKHHKSRYPYVAEVVSNGELLTLTEIKKELGKLSPPVIMSLQGIKKNLQIMEANYQVVYLEFKKNVKKLSKFLNIII